MGLHAEQVKPAVLDNPLHMAGELSAARDLPWLYEYPSHCIVDENLRMIMECDELIMHYFCRLTMY